MAQNEAPPIDWELFQILPALLDTLQSIRASEDKEGIQVSKNIQTLIGRLEQCSAIVHKLPSTEFTLEEKEAELQKLQERLKLKCAQVDRYKKLKVLNPGAENSEEPKKTEDQDMEELA